MNPEHKHNSVDFEKLMELKKRVENSDLGGPDDKPSAEVIDTQTTALSDEEGKEILKLDPAEGLEEKLNREDQSVQAPESGTNFSDLKLLAKRMRDSKFGGIIRATKQKETEHERNIEVFVEIWKEQWSILNEEQRNEAIKFLLSLGSVEQIKNEIEEQIHHYGNNEALQDLRERLKR